MSQEKLIMFPSDSPVYKEEFITFLANKHKKPKRYYQEALKDILEGISDHLVEDTPVCFLGFGTFYTRMHKGGTNVSIRTKQKTTYAPFKQAAFKAGTLLKRAVAGKK